RRPTYEDDERLPERVPVAEVPHDVGHRPPWHVRRGDHEVEPALGVRATELGGRVHDDDFETLAFEEGPERFAARWVGIDDGDPPRPLRRCGGTPHRLRNPSGHALRTP